MHGEAKRLLKQGFKLCALHPMSKHPLGDGWQLNPVTRIEDSKGGYGMLLAANGLGSIDPDNVEPARAGLERCGFDLDEIMALGVRTSSTRPGSGGRSTYKVPPDLVRVRFASKTHGTILELRAGNTNLQDCLPGTVYMGKDGGGPYRQEYANGKTMEDAPELPARVLAWWRKMNADLAFKREQQKLLCGDDAMLDISGGNGAGTKLAFASEYRREFNERNNVEAILERHGYTTDGGGRWAPSTATGTPCVRLIPGTDSLWQSDHASDPLCGTFDAWTAHVALDHRGDAESANSAWRPVHDNLVRDEFEDVSEAAGAEADPARHPVPIDWAAMPDDPPEPPFVISGWLPLHVVTLFAAHGGTGKSFISLYIALCLATGRHPFMPGVVAPRVKVVVYSAEDNVVVMQGRLARYMRLLGIGTADLVGWLLVLDATESDNVLFTGDEKVNGRTTARFSWLADQVAAFGATVLIFDNASDALDANENDRAKVRQFMSALKRLAPAVLLLAHVDAVSSMADPGEGKGYSGSTGWHNSARSRWHMYRNRDTDDIVLTLPKVNYAKAGGEAVFRWSDATRVFQFANTREGRAKASDNRGMLLELLRRATRERGINVSPASTTGSSVFNTIKDMDGCPHGLKSNDVGLEVRRWLDDGLAQIEEYQRSNRSIGQRLVLTALGLAACDAGSGAEDFA